MILEMLDDNGEYDIHPIDYTSFYPISISIARDFPNYKGIAFHKELSDLRGQQY